MGFWGHLPQQLVNGLVLGSVYALLALGYSMVYGILRVLNFAHGDVFMVCSFAGWAALTALLKSRIAAYPAVTLLLVLAVAMGVGVALGMAIERFAYRPLRKATRLAPLISAIGVSIFLQNVVMLATGGRAKVYPLTSVIPSGLYLKVGTITVSSTGLLVIGVSIILTLGLNYVIRTTSLGRMMRATAEDIEAAGFMGIPIDYVIAFTFALGSALAGAGGVLIGLYYTQIDFSLGFSAGMKAFTAAVLGGIGNLEGAVLGGVVLGLAESMGTAFIAPVYKDAIAFAILIICLILRPNGILGDDVPEKV
ncbi:MAG TPA: branched-chain amino acid ABC transporter permease [Firmicutes bacterium]|nr:branched-chain amino acid ABC transporter permease [Bacillota bacterium]